MQRIIACILAVIAWIFSDIINPLMVELKLPQLLNPTAKIDMSQFELVWHDEFTGSVLRPEWISYKEDDHLVLEDGKLHIKTSLVENEDGTVSVKTGAINTSGLDSDWRRVKEGYWQTYGYFEIRCKFADGLGIWSAFWIYAGAGSELDVFEAWHAKSEDKFKRESFETTVHYNYYNGNDSLGRFHAADCYDEFHTYGVEWNEEWYIFYIDGNEFARSNANGDGTSAIPQYITVNNAQGDDVRCGKPADNLPGHPTDYVIDYVRCYQYK
ncbi:MAG: family 16 glycosylhydrolase [Oscillospiraceae bacterium]|jgi:hypothetical protein|nr:family 16 glycosylhydrolase [Oscillospiraceae bacterium]